MQELLINAPSMTASVKMESLGMVGGPAGGLICSARFLRPHANEGKNTDQSSCHGELSNFYDALLEFLPGLTNDFSYFKPLLGSVGLLMPWEQSRVSRSVNSLGYGVMKHG